MAEGPWNNFSSVGQVWAGAMERISFLSLDAAKCLRVFQYFPLVSQPKTCLVKVNISKNKSLVYSWTASSRCPILLRCREATCGDGITVRRFDSLTLMNRSLGQTLSLCAAAFHANLSEMASAAVPAALMRVNWRLCFLLVRPAGKRLRSGRTSVNEQRHGETDLVTGRQRV